MTALTTQSTTPATVPSGTAIAADQVGTANPPTTADRIQYVKLDCGGDGASAPVKAGNGLPVSPVDATASGNITATDANNPAAVLGSTAFYNAAPTVGSFIALNVSGMSSAEVMAIGSGWTGTCFIEGSLDSTNGSDGIWTGILFANRANPPQQVHYVNFPGARYHGPVGALKWLRLRCQGGITAGPIPVVLRASLAPAGLELVAPLPNGGNTIGSVSITNAPAQTKGTQATFFMPVQEAKDTGRVNIMWTLEFSPAAVAEALMTMTESRDGATTATFTSKVVTSGKRLRISSWNMVVENTLGANPKRAKLRMRFNTAGAVTTASPLQANLLGSVATAVNTIGQSAFDDFPDGVEFLGDGTKQIGFTLEFPDWVTAAQTGKVYVTIFAFEY